jgi:hypothetical protein
MLTSCSSCDSRRRSRSVRTSIVCSGNHYLHMPRFISTKIRPSVLCWRPSSTWRASATWTTCSQVFHLHSNNPYLTSTKGLSVHKPPLFGGQYWSRVLHSLTNLTTSSRCLLKIPNWRYYALIIKVLSCNKIINATSCT